MRFKMMFIEYSCVVRRVFAQPQNGRPHPAPPTSPALFIPRVALIPYVKCELQQIIKHSASKATPYVKLNFKNIPPPPDP